MALRRDGPSTPPARSTGHEPSLASALEHRPRQQRRPLQRLGQFAFDSRTHPDYASDAIWEAAAKTVPVRQHRPRAAGTRETVQLRRPGTGELQIDVQFNTRNRYVADSINRSAWNDVVHTYSGSDYRVFFNGVEVYSDVFPGDSLTAAYYMLLGIDNNAGSLNGSLDEVRIRTWGGAPSGPDQVRERERPGTFCSLCGAQNVASTAVGLASFTARGFDSSVLVEWETGSELDNLGFHLYRGLTENGPWERLTASLIPGLGSSPEGKRYSFLDPGLRNGVAYYYRLEDVDRSGQVTSHGPVSATPLAGAAPPSEPPAPGPVPLPGPEPGPGGGAEPSGWTAHGDPTDVSLRRGRAHGFVRDLRAAHGWLLFPRAGGRLAAALRARLLHLAEPGFPTLPTRRAWTDAVVGLGARVGSVTAEDLVPFEGLLPPTAGAPQAVSMRDGTYQKAFRPVKAAAALAGPVPPSPGPRPSNRLPGRRQEGLPRARPPAPRRLPGTPRPRPTSARHRRLRRCRLRRDRPRRLDRPPSGPARSAGPERLIARFVSRARGLNAVSWEDLLAATTSGAPDLASSNLMLPTSALRLSHKGTVVPFHVEPRHDRFAPGSTLFFLSEGTRDAHANEAVFELAVAADGQRMPIGVSSRGRSAAPSLEPLASLQAPRSFEKNAVFLPALLEAQDFWLWDYGIALGTTKSYPFSLASVVTTGAPARLTVRLQGGSDMDVDPDHHLRFSVNDTPVAETSFDGMKPHSFSVDVPASLLLEGPNTLSIEDLADTGATQSFVYLDRFSLDYPHALAAEAGTLEGQALTEGVVQAAGFAPGSVLIDLSGRLPRFLGPLPLGSRFRRRGGTLLPRRLPRGLPSPPDPTRRDLLAARLDEPGRLDPHRAQGLPPRGPGTRRSPPGPGPLRQGRRSRGRLRLVRLRRGLPRGHPLLPRLRLPPLDPARSPLRPSPRRGLLRPQGLPHRAPRARTFSRLLS